MKQLLFLVLLCACLTVVYAQEESGKDWVELMCEPNVNVFEVEAAFNAYWGDREYQKGKGFKQFHRWKKLVMPYTDTKGYIHRSHEAQEVQDYQKRNQTKKSQVAWTHIGPVLPTSTGIGRLNSITFHPTNNSILYGGSSSGGLWRSRDAGNSWNPTTDDLPSLGVSDMVIHPANPDIMYMATGDGDGNGATSPSFGIVKTTNAGIDWEVVLPTTGDGQFINELLMNPENPDIILAATSFGLYRTEDAGDNWERMITGTIEDILFKPGDFNTVYACGNGGTGFLRSVDGGVIWTHVTEGLPTGGIGRKMIAVTPANPDYVYIVIGRNRNEFDSALSYTFRGLYRSTNGGLSFELRGNEDPGLFSGQSWYDLALAVSPTNPNQVFLGEVELLRSNNGGDSWQNINFAGGDWVHVDIHDIEFHPQTGDLYVASDGGLYRSANSGSSFTRISNGLGITEYYRMGGSTTNPNIILAGSQDNGTMLYQGTEWQDFGGGDGMECIVDYTNENWRTYSYQNGTIRRYDNGQDSGFISSSTTGESGNWTTPYIQHPTKPDVFYAGYQSVWKTTNRGTAWENISGILTSGSTMEFIAAAPSDADNYIYASDGNRLFVTKDGGENWKTIGVSGRGFLSGIAIHPSNPEILWTAQGRGVFMSEDAGNTWTEISGTLPEIPALTVAYQGGSEETIYVGMTVGVYYKDNTMEDWAPLMDGFPNVRVAELELLPCDGKLRAATYGRGLWEIDMVNYAENSFEVETIISDIGCQSGSNGSVELVISGGVEPYNILWENGATTDKLEFLDGGVYRALVTDATFCRRSVEAVINSALGIADIEVKPASCSDSDDGSIEVSITGGEGTVYYDWGNGITTPSLQNASAGTYVLIVTDDLGCIDAELIDIPATILENYTYPISENFNQTLDTKKVYIENPQEDGLLWAHRLGLAGHSGAMWIENNLSASFNSRDNMTMELDLTTIVNASLSFEVASTGKSNNQFNRLIVEVQACGSTQTFTVYDKEREELNTVPNQSGAFVPTATQWRTETIDLSIFEGQTVLVRFVNVHRRGNNLFIDNIEVDGVTGIETLQDFGFDAQVIPNPNYGNFEVKIEALKSLTTTLEIYNTVGQLLQSRTVNLVSGQNQFDVQLEDAPSGVYFLKLKTEDNELTRKVVKY
ncbi:MAG: T9SS type A sorting domain-containing protein [Chitinophagales bacterium]